MVSMTQFEAMQGTRLLIQPARCLTAGLLLAWGWSASQPAAAQGTLSQGIYTCTDAKGRKLTSDRPIPDCADREQNVLNPSGTLKARVGPVLTAPEIAAQEAKARQEQEVRALQVEERRRDRALVLRYPNRQVHDQERAEAIKQIGAVKAAAITRSMELVRQRKQVEEELEFYKKDPSKVPPSLRRQAQDINDSLAVQGRFLATQDAEITRVNARFDEELVRLAQLWSLQAGTGPAPAASAPKTR
jgi:hypothetical protein